MCFIVYSNFCDKEDPSDGAEGEWRAGDGEDDNQLTLLETGINQAEMPMRKKSGDKTGSTTNYAYSLTFKDQLLCCVLSSRLHRKDDPLIYIKRDFMILPLFVSVIKRNARTG